MPAPTYEADPTNKPKISESEWLERAKHLWNVRTGIASALWLVISAGWAFYQKHLDQKREETLAAAQRQFAENLAKSEAQLRRELNSLQGIQERDRKQLEMLPSALALLRDGKCDADLTSLVLLEELRRFRARNSEVDVGTAAERATLTLLLSRQTAKPEYCTCQALQALQDLTEKGSDERIAELASRLAQLGSLANGPCSSNPEGKQVLTQASKHFGEASYYVVFSNDLSCDEAKHEFRRVLGELKSRLPDFDHNLLRILDAAWLGRNYFVTAYGGSFAISHAAELVKRLAGQGHLKGDLYWTTGRTFSGRSTCDAKGLAALE